ncbi:MAG: hypothetical protein ACRBN8_13385 [Nannocystales bacterium]
MNWDDYNNQRNVFVLLGGLVAGSALVGLLMPSAENGERSHHEHRESAGSQGSSVPPARTYRELGATPWMQPEGFDGALANLPVGGGRQDEATREGWLLERAERRAFDGAPPVVPHAITERSSAACLTCHADGMAFPMGDRASTICHDLHPSCTQCHVPGSSGITNVDVAAADAYFGENLFEGRPGSVGERAAPGAPPMIPHTTWMRERCNACHGEAGPNPLRTTHTTRTHCRQCHGSSAQKDQHPGFG